MVRSFMVIATALLGVEAARAQPVTRPEREPCHVTIVLAPDDVRAEIESWVRAEPRCERELEVRVVPTDEGLYLSAHDALGRVRERVVPDAQSAAVLVVSWMADDSLDPTLPVHSLLEPPTPTERAPVYASDGEDPIESGPPGVAQSFGRVSSRPSRSLVIGALASPVGVGFRGQLDVFQRGRWSAGIAGGYRRGEQDRGTAQARIVLGTSTTFGRFSLRAQVGVGVDVSEGGGDRMDLGERMRDGDHPDARPAAELGVFANLRLTDDWGLVGGPILEANGDGRPDLSVFVGIRRGL